MAQCNSVNVRPLNSELDEIKWGAKNGEKVTLRLSSDVTGNGTDETSFPHKLLLTDRQVLKIHKAFVYNYSASIN